MRSPATPVSQSNDPIQRHYRLHGLCVCSDVPLPWISRQPNPIPDLTVHSKPYDQRDGLLADSRLVATTDPGQPTASAQVLETPYGILLHYPDVGDFLIERGCRSIEVYPKPGTPIMKVSTTLAGMPTACMLALKGLLPLHASTVHREGRTTAFVGPCGIGKSTMAAACLGIGADLITDDMTIVDDRGPGDRVHWTEPTLRLSRAQFESIETAGTLQVIDEPTEGRLLLLHSGIKLPLAVPPRTSSLDQIVILERGKPGDELLIQRPGPGQATARLCAHLFVSTMFTTKIRQRDLKRVAGIVGRTPVLIATIPPGQALLPRIASTLLQPAPQQATSPSPSRNAP